jgi:hypothetical protein
MRKTIIGVSLAAGCALAVTACGGQESASPQHGSAQSSSQAGTQRPAEAIAATYQATKSASTAKITQKGTTTVGGKTVHTHGHGVVQLKPAAFDLHVTAKGRTVEERLIDGAVYVKTPQGKWLKTNVSKLTGQPGSAHSPSQTLSYLRGASKKVTKLGPSTIHGRHTTGYKARVDLNKVAATEPTQKAKKAVTKLEQITGSHTLPIKVWIDGKNRLVREKISLDAHIQGKHVTTTSTTTLSDYGTRVHVAKPPASQVTSAPASTPHAH